MAVAGLTTPSIAAANSGSSNLKASISQEMSTSSGSRVRRLGTIAMSSNPYARRPDLPMPISTSAMCFPSHARKQLSVSGSSYPRSDLSTCFAIAELIS